MSKVNKDMLISDIISINRGVIPILMKAGMNCAGCPSAQSETLSEAASSHGENVDELVKSINMYLASADTEQHN